MRTVELFSGIGGFRLAADQRGHQTVWANDSCPKACRVYRDRFGAETLNEGDIRKLQSQVPPHELLTAGFPCQPFSSAGKKLGVKDPRGTLFGTVVEVLAKREPAYFVLENVKRLLTMERGVHFATILAALAKLDYLIEWRLLNALHFGLPQNRQRVVLIGTRTDRHDRHPAANDGLPPIRLASGHDLEALSPQCLDRMRAPKRWSHIGRHGKRFAKWGLAYKGRFVASDVEAFSEAVPTPTLRSMLQKKVDRRFDFTDSTLERIGASTMVNRYVGGVEILSNQAGGARMGYTVFGINGVAPTLTSTASRHYERYKVGARYRRLTNVEYAKLQGFPRDHCRALSTYDQYASFGAAVPPPMVGWVMDRIVSPGVAPMEFSVVER